MTTDDKFTSRLIGFGLSEKEAYTYLHLIKYGPKTPPASSIRGASFFRTRAPKLARLNSIVCVYEVEANEDWTYTVKDWKWK